MPDELQRAFEINNIYKKIMSMPEKVIAQRDARGANTMSRFNATQQYGKFWVKPDNYGTIEHVDVRRTADTMQQAQNQ